MAGKTTPLMAREVLTSRMMNNYTGGTGVAEAAECKFLIARGLKIHNEEGREEGRQAVRAIISRDDDDDDDDERVIDYDQRWREVLGANY